MSFLATVYTALNLASFKVLYFSLLTVNFLWSVKLILDLIKNIGDVCLRNVLLELFRCL